MQNFMKTIISAIQSWTNDKIKDSTADWNQNDEKANDYIKNRTHYEELNKNVLFPQTNITFLSSGYDGGLQINPVEFVEGKTYVVVWDNIKYECKCFGFSGAVIGNTGLEGYIIDTGEPFLIRSSFSPDNLNHELGTIMASTAGEHTIEIYTAERIVHKIDKKYLPIETSDWNQNDENAPNHIKNRPFYEGTEDLILVPEQTIAVENGGADFEYDVAVENMFEYGYDCEYTVIFDGVSYTGTSYTDSDACMRTDFVTNDGYKVEVYDYSFLHVSGMIGEHTIQIILNNMPVVHKMDEKFIPDTVATKDELTRQTDIKMDMSSPTGYGAFSMNRSSSIQVGSYSTAIGYNTIATSKSQFAFGEYNKALQNKYFVATTDKASITVPYRNKIYVSMSYTLNDDTGKFVLDNPIEVDISGPHMDIDNYYCTGNNTSSFYLLKSSGTIMDGGKKETYLWGTVYTSKLVTDNRMEYLLCAGNGTSDTERSNAHTLDWSGNAWYQGEVYVGGTGQDDENAKMLATQEYVDNTIPDETDALNLLMEEGFVEPLADVDGTIYTTPDGDIYTLD